VLREELFTVPPRFLFSFFLFGLGILMSHGFFFTLYARQLLFIPTLHHSDASISFFSLENVVCP
jgi:hypothetical protein